MNNIEEELEQEANNYSKLEIDPSVPMEDDIKNAFILGAKSEIAKKLHTKDMYTREQMELAFIAGENNGRDRDFAKPHDIEYCKNSFKKWLQNLK